MPSSAVALFKCRCREWARSAVPEGNLGHEKLFFLY